MTSVLLQPRGRGSIVQSLSIIVVEDPINGHQKKLRGNLLGVCMVFTRSGEVTL